MTERVVQLTEWQTASPDTTAELKGLCLPETDQTRALLRRLSDRQMVVVRELRTGIEIRTTSYVGSVSVGPLTLRIQPKLEPASFAILIGYAFGLPRMELLPEHAARLSAPAFQDLLIARLVDEVTRLLARGIYRQHNVREARLGSPRGRIMFGAMSRQGPVVTATVPCRFHERDENVLPNRVLLSGVRLGATLAVDSATRGRALRAAAGLAEHVEPLILNAATMQRVERSSTRLLSAYQPAFALIRLLLTGHGISLQSTEKSFPLPGFLFDMNMLFQEALGRFLSESLDDVQVNQQHPLADLFAYQPLFNPRRKRAPTPRPDYVFIQDGGIIAIADAKYRDLWEHELGRDMLYQLTIYALSQTQCRSAAILYPAQDSSAQEARVTIYDPMSGHPRGEVHLRPVDIGHVARLISQPRGAQSSRQQEAYAKRLVFGLG